MDTQPVEGQGMLPIGEVWLSLSQIAGLKKVSIAAISKRVIALEADGLITTRRDGREKKVNLVQFDRAIGATTDPAQALRNPGGIALPTTNEPSSGSSDSDTAAEKKSATYNASKELIAGYQAENERLDLEERLERLVDKADVEARTFAVFRRLRDRALSFPATVAPRLAGTPDERAVRMILDEEMRKLLDALANNLDNPDAVETEEAVEESADAASAQ